MDFCLRRNVSVDVVSIAKRLDANRKTTIEWDKNFKEEHVGNIML